jgi:hypothetical protein
MADQRENIYRFEDDFPGWSRNQLTLAECRTLIRSACAAYGVPAARVRQHHQRSMSWCIPATGLISLQARGPQNRGGKNAATALHEAAHHIVYALYGNRVDDHGPTFAGVYLALLVKANVAPRAALEAQMRYRGVKWRKGLAQLGGGEAARQKAPR